MIAFLVAVACTGLSPSPAESAEVSHQPAPVHVREIVSQRYHIDKKYASMRGPHGFDHATLLDGPRELVWIVGYHTEVVDAESKEAVSQEFMCHANLDFDASEYYQTFSTRVPLSGRVFTLSQGQQDIAFPEGYGIPVPSDMDLSLATQVLNLNIDNPKKLNVRHKVQVRFVRDSEATVPMQALYQSAVEGFKALTPEARYYGLESEEVDPSLHGPGCDLGQAAVLGDEDPDALGQKFTAHWVVEPGEEVNRTNVTRFLNLPFDTRAHYVAVHLHPFAESLTLKDLTAGKTVLHAKAMNTPDRIGLKHVEHYAGADGIQLHKDHEYELVSVYKNTSDQAVDSMAVMYLYLHDPTFEKPVW
jgi:hypothetical protein